MGLACVSRRRVLGAQRIEDVIVFRGLGRGETGSYCEKSRSVVSAELSSEAAVNKMSTGSSVETEAIKCTYSARRTCSVNQPTVD